eukprot:1415302-Rhodomonas_salina.3
MSAHARGCLAMAGADGARSARAGLRMPGDVLGQSIFSVAKVPAPLCPTASNQMQETAPMHGARSTEKAASCVFFRGGCDLRYQQRACCYHQPRRASSVKARSVSYASAPDVELQVFIVRACTCPQVWVSEPAGALTKRGVVPGRSRR